MWDAVSHVCHEKRDAGFSISTHARGFVALSAIVIIYSYGVNSYGAPLGGFTIRTTCISFHKDPPILSPAGRLKKIRVTWKSFISVIGVYIHGSIQATD